MNRFLLSEGQILTTVNSYKPFINPQLHDEFYNYIASINETDIKNEMLWGKNFNVINKFYYQNNKLLPYLPDEQIADYRGIITGAVVVGIAKLYNNEQFDISSQQLDLLAKQDILRGIAYFSPKGLEYCKNEAFEYLPEDLIQNLPALEQMHKSFDQEKTN